MLELFNGVVSLQKNSFIDFPGRASALLFYAGCNLHCPFCHNPTLANSSAEKTHTPREILEFLEKRRNFLDGVVITGGEPTLYESVVPLIEYLKSELGYEVKLDSNGLRPELLRRAKWDYLAMDLKTSFDRYTSLLDATGNAQNLLRQSLQVVKDAGKNAEIRITCAPGVIDDAVIETMLPELEGVHQVYLQRFKFSESIMEPDFFLDKPTLTDEDLDRFRERIGTVVEKCEIRGR